MKRGVAAFMVLVLVLALGATAFVAFGIGGGGGGGATATSRSTTTSTVKFSGTGGKAFCQADQEFNDAITQQAPKTADAAALKADYQRRLGAVRGLEALAPPEIKGDVTAIRGAYEALAAPLDTVGYDLSKLSAADKAKIQTPEVNLAGARLDQYDTQICKLNPGGTPSTTTR